MDREIVVANGDIKVEYSPTYNGMAWLNFKGSGNPELTPHQMRKLANALDLAADELERV